MKIVETERLSLKKFTIQDAEFIYQLLNSPKWIRYIGDRGIKSLADAENYIQTKLIWSYHNVGFGLYRVDEKISNKPIGMCGLVKRETLNFPDIGFAFLPIFEQQGFAFESADAVMKFARLQLKLKTIGAITTQDNLRSIQLIKKLNMEFDSYINLPDDNETLMLFTSAIEE